MYKITKKDLNVLICMRKNALGCSYDEATAIIMEEYNLAEDIRKKNQYERKKEYAREYNKKYREKLKSKNMKEKISNLLIN